MPDGLDLRGEELAPGATVRALRAHAGRVEHLTLDIDVGRLVLGADDVRARLFLERDAVHLEVDAGRYAWVLRLAPRSASGSELLLGLYDAWVFGAPNRSVGTLASCLAENLDKAGIPAAVEGVWTLSVDLVNAVRRRLAPASPSLQGDLAWQIEVTPPAGVMLRGRRALPSGTVAPAEEATDIPPGADVVRAFRTLLSQHPGGEERAVWEDRLLALGLGVPELRDDVDALAVQVLDRKPTRISALLARAGAAAQAGWPERAAPYLESAARNLRRAGARRAAGLALRFASEAYHDAPGDRARHLEDAIALRPDDRTALSELLTCLPALGRTAAAVRVARRLARVEDTAEGRGRAHLVAGRLLLEGLDEAHQAAREFERASRALGPDPEVIEVQARAAAALGAYPRAEALLTTLLREGPAPDTPEDLGRLRLLFGTLVATRAPAEALSHFREARRLLPNRLEPLARLAKTGQEVGQRDVVAEALAVAEVLVARGVHPSERPHAFDLAMLAGQQLVERGDPGRAAALFRTASGLVPTSPEPHRAMESVAVEMGDRLGQSEAILAQARLAAFRGDSDTAVQLLAHLAKLDPLPPTARAEGRAIARGLEGRRKGHSTVVEVELALAEGDLPAVVEVLERRTRHETDASVRGQLYAKLGASLEESGRTVEATHAYEEARRLVDEAAPDRALARLYRARGDQERLLRALERLADRETDPEVKTTVLMEWARLLQIRGDQREALEVVRRALDLGKGHPGVLGLATELALATGEIEFARISAEERLGALGPDAEQDRLATYLDLAVVYDRAKNRAGVVEALREAHQLSDSETEEGRNVARRLARELWAAERYAELATLHRELGEISSLNEILRAEHYAEAAQLSCRLGVYEQVEVDAARALKLLGDPPRDRALSTVALDALAASADAQSDSVLRAVVFGRRAAWAQSDEERERWVLDQAEALVDAGRLPSAQAVLQEAARGLPRSVMVQEQLGIVAQQADSPLEAAAAFGRAAYLSVQREPRRAVALHGRAADIYTLEARREQATEHDRAVFSLASASAVESAWLKNALERLLRVAQKNSDFELWSQVLDRQAVRIPPEEMAAAYLELAEAQLEVGGRERGVLDALRRARDRAPETGHQADVVHTRLAEILSRTGLFAELAQVWTAWAERTVQPRLKSERYVEAARVLLDRIKDKRAALFRLEAALRADPESELARQLRLRVLRETEEGIELAEALAEEAERSTDPRCAAKLWLEAARRTADSASNGSSGGRRGGVVLAERALSWAAAARAAAPKDAEAAFLGAAIARGLGKRDEEQVALQRAIEREPESIRTAAARIRYAELLQEEGLVTDAVAPAAEALIDVIARPEDERGRVEGALPSATRRALGSDVPFLDGLGRWALRAAEAASTWDVAVRMCHAWADVTADSGRRAELLTRAAELYAEELGDDQGAERALVEALEAVPGHEPARRALLRVLEASDRFDDIAEHLGADVLLGVWDQAEDQPRSRRIRLAEALRRWLSSPVEDRARVLLVLADLYIEAGAGTSDALGVLEELAESGPVFERGAALGRLFERGPRGRTRAMRAAEARASRLDAEARGAHWMAVADVIRDSPHGEPEREREALERAVDAKGSNEVRALARLREVLSRMEDHGALVTVLERIAEVEPGSVDALSIPLVRAWLARARELGADGAGLERRAEVELRRVLDAGAPNPQADALLRTLWTRQRRYRDLAERYGPEALGRLLADAGDPRERKEMLEVRARLSEGAERAAALFELLELVDVPALDVPSPDVPRTAVDLSAAILELQADGPETRARLLDRFRRAHRYADVATVLGVETLRAVVREMNDDDPGAQVAFRALADRLEGDPLARQERGDLLVRAGRRHRATGDVDAAKEAYALAYRTARDPTEAGHALSDLLAEAHRVGELATIDEALAVQLAVRAANRGQPDLQVEALDAVAGVRTGAARADVLTWAAAVCSAAGDSDRAQVKLEQALVADPDHALTRSELTALLLENDAAEQVVDRFGPEVFLRAVARLVKRAPDRALEFLRTIPDDSLDGVLALRAELAGRVSVPSEEPGEDRARRRQELQVARRLCGAIGDVEGEARVSLRLLDLARETEDPAVILGALRDARRVATRPDGRARLSVQEAAVIVEQGLVDEARGLVAEVIADESVLLRCRLDAAELLVDALEPVDRADPTQRQALELLGAHHASRDAPDEHVAQWFRRLADAREAVDDDGTRVGEALEQVLLRTRDPEEALVIRRRLLTLADELGDWSAAERHATRIAEAERSARSWVDVSELRRWLDDRAGAREALKRALALEPNEDDAHRALVDLAEQGRDVDEIIARLSAWSEAKAPVEERFDRLLRAADVAVLAQDASRAGQLAEEATRLMPADHPDFPEQALAAAELLAPVDAVATQIEILGRVAAAGRAGADVRLALADLLSQNGRARDAREALEGGLDVETPADGPLVDRIVHDGAAMAAGRGARWLLGLAERLGGGPAARRLREAGAVRAEEAGDLSAARAAWSAVMAEPGSGAAGVRARSALVRLYQSQDDAPALLSVLLEVAEDARTEEEKVARLLEAATVSDERLDDRAQADALFVRARMLAPGDRTLRRRYVAFLERHERWTELEHLLAQESLDLDGEELAEFCLRRAEIVRGRLKDEMKAATLYVAAYEADPRLHTGDLAVGALARTGSLADAIAMAERVLEDDAPGDHTLQLSIALARAELLELDGRVDEAVETLERLDREEPGVGAVQAGLQGLLQRSGRWGKLAGHLERVAEGLRPVSAIRALLAAVHIWTTREEDEDRAEAALRAAFGIMQTRIRQADEADFDRLSLLVPTDALDIEIARSESPLVDLACLARELGQRELQVSALRLFAESLPGERGRWPALLLLADAERERGDVTSAELNVQRVLDAQRDAMDVSPAERAVAERAYGEVLLEQGRHDAALDAFQSARDLLAEDGGSDEEDAHLLYRQGVVHMVAGRLEDAVASFLQARAKRPDAVPAEEFAHAVERAEPSEALAELLIGRANRHEQGRGRAELFLRAHRLWVDLNRDDRALEALLAAHESEPEDLETTDLLAARLDAAGRYPELLVILERTLAVVGDEDPAAAEAILVRAARSADRLHRPEDALTLVKRVSGRIRHRPNVTRLLADLSERAGHLETADEAWGLIQERATEVEERLAAAKRRCRLLGEAKALKKRAHVLAEVLSSRIARATSAELVALDTTLGDADRHEARTRMWAEASESRSGFEAASCLAQVGTLRRDALADPRGAVLAFEMATRVAPDVLGFRRSALASARALQDHRRVVKHARSAADRALTLRARCAFLKEAARAWAAMGELGSELEMWRMILEEGGPVPSVLEEIEARVFEDLPARETVKLLVAATHAQADAAAKAVLLRLQARIQERVLDDREAASELLADARTLDPSAKDVSAGPESRTEPVPPLDEDALRKRRSMLDRSGRVEELAELEVTIARRDPHPERRATGLATAAERLLTLRASGGSGGRSAYGDRSAVAAARALLEESLRADPDGVGTWSLAFDAALSEGDLPAARQAADALIELGGPGWAPPRFEERLIELARQEGDRDALVNAVLRAEDHAPWSLPARRARTELSDDPAIAGDLLDPVLEATELGEILQRWARRALEEDRPEEGLDFARQVNLLLPGNAEVQGMLLDALAAAGAEVELLDACLAEIHRSGPSAEFVDRALGAAEAAVAWPPVSERLVRLCTYLPGAERQAYDRIVRLGVERGDGVLLAAALAVLGSPEHLGAPEPVAFGRLAAAVLGRGAWEAAAEVLNLFLASDGGPTARFETATREAFLPRGGLAAALLRAPQEAGPGWARCLRALYLAQPRTPGLIEAHARALLPHPEARTDAFELVERLVEERPLEPEWIEALAECADATEQAGRRAVARYLATGRSETIEVSPRTLCRDESEPHLRGGPSTPLGEILWRGARAAAADLATAHETDAGWRPGDQDARLEGLLGRVRASVRNPFAVFIDPAGGYRVRLAAGDPPRLVVGEALADDLSPGELRFWIARGARLLELGWFSGLDPAERRGLLDRLMRASKEGPPSGRLETLARRLGEDARAAIAEHEAALASLTPEDWARWIRSTRRSADRFGFLVSGELSDSIRAVMRRDARLIGRPTATRADRVRLMREWSDVRSLVQFAVSKDLVALLAGGTSSLGV